jgi:hypothetical protein
LIFTKNIFNVDRLVDIYLCLWQKNYADFFCLEHLGDNWNSIKKSQRIYYLSYVPYEYKFKSLAYFDKLIQLVYSLKFIIIFFFNFIPITFFI